MKRWSLGVYVALLVLSGIVIYESIAELSLVEYGQPGSGLLPFLLAVLLAILSITVILIGDANAGESRLFLALGPAKRLLVAIALLVASSLVFEPLGAPVTVGLMVALWLMMLERKRIWVALFTGGLTGLSIWLVFCLGFKAQLPLGFWTR